MAPWPIRGTPSNTSGSASSASSRSTICSRWSVRGRACAPSISAAAPERRRWSCTARCRRARRSASTIPRPCLRARRKRPVCASSCRTSPPSLPASPSISSSPTPRSTGCRTMAASCGSCAKPSGQAGRSPCRCRPTTIIRPTRPRASWRRSTSSSGIWTGSWGALRCPRWCSTPAGCTISDSRPSTCACRSMRTSSIRARRWCSGSSGPC